MKLLCSRCNNVIRDEPSGFSSDRVITSGTCDQCASLLLWPNRPAMVEFLDGLDAPVVVINLSGNVCAANKMARDLLQKDLFEIEGFQGGNVFECAFAKLPEGCGKTIHCDGCTIRNTVMDTLHSGNSHTKIPTGLSQGTSDDYAEMQLLISTEKINSFVMLRIDSIL